MNIYHYDETGEYKGTAVARQDPLDSSRYLIPRNATTIAPPAAEEGKALVFSGSAWGLREDHRGKLVYNEENRTGVMVFSLGPVPSGFVLDAPTSDFDELVEGVWIKDEAAELDAWRASLFCGPLQFRRALRAMNLMQTVKTYMETAPEEVVEAWEYATSIVRMDPLVLAMQQELEASDEDVDNLFRLALTFP